MVEMQTIATHWWTVLLRGIVAVLFGAVAFAFPFSTALAFVFVFGGFALADGLLTVVAAFRMAHPSEGRWWSWLLQGLVGIAIGAITFFWPGITWQALGLLVAAWALITGVLEIAAAFRLRKNVPGEFLLFVTGLLSVILGLYLAVFAGVGLLALVWVVGAYALIAGFALIVLSLRLRGLRRT